MTHDFTIVVQGDCTEPEIADALFEAFDDDPGLSRSGHLSYIAITVEEETLTEAMIRGLKQFLDADTGLDAVGILTESSTAH